MLMEGVPSVRGNTVPFFVLFVFLRVSPAEGRWETATGSGTKRGASQTARYFFSGASLSIRFYFHRVSFLPTVSLWLCLASREHGWLAREERARRFYEKHLEERRKKLEEQKQREERRRNAVEEKRRQRLKEERVSLNGFLKGSMDRKLP